MNQEILQRVPSFPYLGIHIDHRGFNKKEFVALAGKKCANSIKIVKRIGVNQSGFDIKTKILTFKTMVRSRIEYGMSVLNFNVEELKKLESVQHKAPCDVFSVSTNTSSNALKIFCRIYSLELRSDILRTKYLTNDLDQVDNDHLLLPKITKWLKNCVNIKPTIQIFKKNLDINSINQNKNKKSITKSEFEPLYTKYFNELSKCVPILRDTELRE